MADQNETMFVRFVSFLLCLSVVLAQSPQAQSPAPALHGETLDGKKVTLAEAGAGRVTLLVVGFSKKAGDATNLWRDRFAADCY